MVSRGKKTSKAALSSPAVSSASSATTAAAAATAATATATGAAVGPPKLISRESFKDEVFGRDGYRCVVAGCGGEAKDAHHIIERKLFPDGGYYLDNGVSLCNEHHMEVEKTTISCAYVRQRAGITRIIIPPQLDSTRLYDKWANPLYPPAAGTPMTDDNGVPLIDGDWESLWPRSAGPLFLLDNVQKIIKQGGLMHLFMEGDGTPIPSIVPTAGAPHAVAIMTTLPLATATAAASVPAAERKTTSVPSSSTHTTTVPKVEAKRSSSSSSSSSGSSSNDKPKKGKGKGK